jgi:ABC-2 type transport system ATP-binding protein
MNAIRVRGLKKAYKGHQAVAGVDLDVARGEVFAVLGPNGAGKTTSVEILEGHRDRDAGEVSVLGVDPARGTREWRSKLGIVLQSATDAATLTVREAVQHYAKYYGNPRDPDEVIDLVGLTEKARSRGGTLSGGQRRRLDVALGLIGRPELVFLDPEARRQFWSLIKLLAAEGTTILLTTHYLDEAEALADRVAVLADGKIVAEGTPQTLGGRAHADATVRWMSDRGYTEIRTSEPTKTIAELSRDGELAELTVTRPSLEDVYLELIK